jgi:lipopolysaccharide/colanic/teichoic acid biosynthesis glycosyltransferase
MIQVLRQREAAFLPLAGFEKPMAQVAKRLFDLVVSLVAFVLLLPLLAVLVIAVCIESPGNPIFLQTRVGQYGKPFRLLKLRTMVADAERRRAEVEHLNESKPPLFKCRKDPRVTRLGRFLRASSLDEVPQLLNVILGDMSLVGPRPRLPQELDGLMHRPDVERRLQAKPGLAGVWQVNGRANNDFDAALKLDLFYVDHWSFAFDLQLIARTFLVLLTARAC